MASNNQNYGIGGYEPKNEGYTVDQEKNDYDLGPRHSSTVGSVRIVSDQTHRKLKSRHIQLIGIGGTIGTALYVQIGRGLMNGGPGSLFLAFSLWVRIDCQLLDEEETPFEFEVTNRC
jgi:amino acid transporter